MIFLRYSLKKAFTLVELIVTITILAILGLIGFISLQGYSLLAKDTQKETDLALVDKIITLSVAKGTSVNISKLKKITYSAYPADVFVYSGELPDGMFDDMPKAPLDPYTNKPYVIAVYTGGNGGLVKYGQVGAVLINPEGTATVDPGVPVQRVRGNYSFNSLNGIAGLIPRWSLENMTEFKTTDFYTNGTKIYGGTWGNRNSYTFAYDGNPVVQVVGTTTPTTLLYESFENMDASPQWVPGNSANGFIPYLSCVSTASFVTAYEWNSTYGDHLQTVDCKIDKSTGASSQHSFYLKWIRDSAGGDGQYNYQIIDPNKKYQFSMDVKGHLDATVSGGKLSLTFMCVKKAAAGQVVLGSRNFLMSLSNSFSTISAFVNTPDAFGNNLSMNLPGGITDTVSCIFYRANAPKMGDELWFDNMTIKEIL